MGFGDEFLKHPSLFPARLAGASAGDRELLVDVAGGPYRLSGLSDSQASALNQRYGERCLPDPSEGAPILIRLFTAREDEFLASQRDGRVNTFDFDYREHSVSLVGHRIMASIGWRPELTAAFWTLQDDGPSFLESFENCFRAVVAYRLLELGGALLHSSGVVERGRAWVFFGHSGAGKTTIARRSLGAGLTVLSDDINAVWVDGGLAVVAKLPFAGELGPSNERVGPYPLAGLCLVRQAARSEWTSMSAACAVASLLSCAPFANRDPHRLPVLLSNLEALARATNTGILGSSLHEDFWPLLAKHAS